VYSLDRITGAGGDNAWLVGWGKAGVGATKPLGHMGR